MSPFWRSSVCILHYVCQLFVLKFQSHELILGPVPSEADRVTCFFGCRRCKARCHGSRNACPQEQKNGKPEYGAHKQAQKSVSSFCRLPVTQAEDDHGEPSERPNHETKFVEQPFGGSPVSGRLEMALAHGYIQFDSIRFPSGDNDMPELVSFGARRCADRTRRRKSDLGEMDIDDF